MNQWVGTVIRADGTVPFDDGVDEDIKAHILLDLVNKGYTLQLKENGKDYQITNWNV